jgi:hypothetical protein
VALFHDALEPAEVPLLLHAAIVAAAAATAMATMTGFGKRRMRLSSPDDAGISAVTTKRQTSTAGDVLQGPRKFMFIFRNFRYHRNREVIGQPFVSKALRSCVTRCDARIVAFSAEVAIP